MEALYTRTREGFAPTELTRGPWDPNAQHGGPPAALIAGELERHGDGKPFARIALQVQGDRDRPVPEVPLRGSMLKPPGESTIAPRFTPYTMFGGDGVEVRFATGQFRQPGPAAAWFRLQVPVVDDEPVTPLQRAMAAADFGNGISSAVSWEQFTFVNPELTVFMLREPEGDWVGNDAVTAIDPGGIGLADATLHDGQGPFARALQTLYVAAR